MAENSDTVDANLFSKKSPEIPAKPTETRIPIINVHSINYDMNHLRRGQAIIFNHYRFDDPRMGTRGGTSKDCNDLKGVLEHYGFQVTVHDDLKYGKIYDVLSKVAKEDHTECDCLLIAVLSHGDDGRLHAKDTKYRPETLWTAFAGESCTSLVGKPKIFIIQACRGDKVDSGAQIKSDASSLSTYTIPAMADILVMYSTFEGHYSFRSAENGSWFIQSLYAELMEPTNIGRDILQILTFVNRRVALQYRSNVPGNRELHKKKQIGSIVSSLTKILYLTPKND